METIKSNVQKLLKYSVRARNDDKYLLWLYWTKIQNAKIYIPFEDFDKLVPFETISRCRRHIQNKEGLFKPTTETAIKRQHQEVKFKEYFMEK